MDGLTLNILGTSYTVHVRTEETDEALKLCSGYCDPTTHSIVVTNQSEKNPGDISDWVVYQRRILRHEIIHAFLFESGLGGDATYREEGDAHPELMVDWFARQAPKIYEVYRAANAI